MNVISQLYRPFKGLNPFKAENVVSRKNSVPTKTIQSPHDMYLHTPVKSNTAPHGCPTEWWWHTGTLKTDDGRVFGFEINAAAYYPKAFTELMLSDIAGMKDYQQTASTTVINDSWAESDPNKDWSVDLLNIQMRANNIDPAKNMLVKATLVDGNATVLFDLKFSEQKYPLTVSGTGESTELMVQSIGTNSYSYSLTRLQASGTIVIQSNGVTETLKVSGVTWLNHEWGTFNEQRIAN